MIRQPQIVMAEIGDVFPARAPEALIVGAALEADATRQVEPVQAGIAEPGDDLLTAVGAGVADDPGFEIRVALLQQAVQRMGQRSMAVPGRDDDRNRRFRRR